MIIGSSFLGNGGPRGFEPQEGFNSRRRTPKKSWSRGEDRFQTPHPNLRNPGSSCPRLLPCSDHPLLPFLPPPSPPFSCPQGAPTLGKNVPFWLTLAMVTAHPHPRAPQQRGLALRETCKSEGLGGGGGTHISQARGHTSAALVATATGGVAKCAVSKQQRILSGTPYSSNSLWTGFWGATDYVLKQLKPFQKEKTA